MIDGIWIDGGTIFSMIKLVLTSVNQLSESFDRLMELFTLRASRRGHSDVDAHVWHDVTESGAIRRKVLYASTLLARTPFCVMRRAGASGICMIVRAKRRSQQRQYRNLPAGRHDLISASDSKNKRPKDV